MRQETLNEMLDFLTDMESELEDENVAANQRRAVTTLIMRSALALLVILALINGFFLFQLAHGLENNLKSAQAMTAGFSDISTSMHGITGDVIVMASNVKELDMIHQDIGVMTHTMGNLSQKLAEMRGDVTEIDRHMFGFDTSLASMEREMVVLGHDVKKISGGVDRMATPMKMFNSMMPW